MEYTPSLLPMMSKSWFSFSDNHRPYYPVLEEVGIEVLVEPVLKLDLRLLPRNLVREGDLGAVLQLLPGLGGQVHVHDLPRDNF